MADLESARELEQALGRLLLRRNRTALYDAALEGAPDGVDRQTYPVLSGLARLGPLSAAALAEEVGIDRSGASRYADRLQAAGLIERTPDPGDRRARLLALTPEGRRVVSGMRESLARHLAERIENWPESRVATLVDGLRLLVPAPRD
jgi:DNA-binding MarR family transcriptional regulator